jgi:uncharacterized protein YeaO (DUF488 family)
MVRLKRVYEKPFRKDGLRILVDRLWPLGLTKERAAVDALELLKRKSNAHTVTLVYAARDEQHSEAVVLKRVLGGRG